jgi:hypothetical protein
MYAATDSPGSARSSEFRVALLAAAVALGGLAAYSGEQFKGDPLAHYHRAAVAPANFRSFATDRWTRPVPRALYALGAPLGVDGAAVVPVLVALLALGASIVVLRRCDGSGAGALAVAVGFLAQPAALDSGHLTLTSGPYTAVVALAAACALSPRPAVRVAAYAVAGLLPLCCAEGFAAAGAFGFCAWWVESQRFGRLRPRDLALRALTGFAPALAWFAAGFAATGDAGWYFQKGGYGEIATLRDGPWPWWFVSSALTRLPQTVPFLALALCGVGAVSSLRRSTPDAAGRQERRAPGLVLLGAPALVGWIVVSLTYTSPQPSARFFVGVNLKVVAAAAPFVAVLFARGAAELIRRWQGGPAVAGLALAAAIAAVGLPVHLFDRIGLSRTPAGLWDPAATEPPRFADAWSALASVVAQQPRYAGKYAAAALGLVVVATLFARTNAGTTAARLLSATFAGGKRPLLRIAGAAALVVAAHATSAGGIWKIADPRGPSRLEYRLLDAFGAWYVEHCPARPEVVQSLTPNLRHFCGEALAADRTRAARSARLGFSWSHTAEAARETAPPGTLFLLGFEKAAAATPPPAEFADPARFEPVDATFDVDGVSYRPTLFRMRGASSKGTAR